VRDLAADLERRLDALEADPGRLADVEERLHRIETLRRKYGATVETCSRTRRRRARELDGVEGRPTRTRRAQAERSAGVRGSSASAAELSRGRQRAAEGARARAVEPIAAQNARDAEARFEVRRCRGARAEDCRCERAAPKHRSSCSAPNKGERPKPLRDVAEWRRADRARVPRHKQALPRAERGMVLVFDEVGRWVGARRRSASGGGSRSWPSGISSAASRIYADRAAYAQTPLPLAKPRGARRTGWRWSR